MNLTVNELTAAVEKLAKDTETKTVHDVLENILNAAKAEQRDIDLMDREAYIAAVLWQEEDIATALEEEHWEPTPANREAVKNEMCRKAMEEGMTERGWDYITEAISQCENKGQLTYHM